MKVDNHEEMNKSTSHCNGIKMVFISDKQGVEREKQVKNAMGRVIISNIKQQLAHDKEK